MALALEVWHIRVWHYSCGITLGCGIDILREVALGCGIGGGIGELWWHEQYDMWAVAYAAMGRHGVAWCGMNTRVPCCPQ